MDPNRQLPRPGVTVEGRGSLDSFLAASWTWITPTAKPDTASTLRGLAATAVAGDG